MFEATRPVPPPRLLRYVALYILYALIVAMGYIVVVHVWLSAIVAMIGAFLGHSYANRIAYMVSMVVLGTIMFIVVIAAEPYLHQGMEQRQLLMRFARLAMPIALLGFLGLLLWRIGVMIMA
jgi:hypothetical protein